MQDVVFPFVGQEALHVAEPQSVIAARKREPAVGRDPAFAAQFVRAGVDVNHDAAHVAGGLPLAPVAQDHMQLMLL
jgi:hypothetical protein